MTTEQIILTKKESLIKLLTQFQKPHTTKVVQPSNFTNWSNQVSEGDWSQWHNWYKN